MRSAYIPHEQDDDWGQADTMVRDVLDDAARDRLVSNIAGHLLNGVTEPVLQRACDYWRNVDKQLGEKIETEVRAKQDDRDLKCRPRRTRLAPACSARLEDSWVA